MPKLQPLCLFLLSFLLAPVGAQNLNDELLAAARKSDVEKVKALLDKGADVNTRSPYGATPLFFACDRGSVEVVQVLLARGADVNAKDKFYGATPLNWALSKGKPEIIKLLVEKGAGEKEAALSFGVRGGHAEVVKAALAQGGIKQETLDKQLVAAKHKGNAEVVELLKGAGAKELPEYKVEPDALKLYEGVYKGETMTFTVKVKDGKLVGTANGSDSTLVPVRQHVFDVAGEDGTTATFIVEGGSVTGLTVKFPNGQMNLKKGEAK
jgi:hypothetical protein